MDRLYQKLTDQEDAITPYSKAVINWAVLLITRTDKHITAYVCSESMILIICLLFILKNVGLDHCQCTMIITLSRNPPQKVACILFHVHKEDYVDVLLFIFYTLYIK